MLRDENLPPWLSAMQLDYQLGLEGIELPEVDDDEEVDEEVEEEPLKDIEN